MQTTPSSAQPTAPAAAATNKKKEELEKKEDPLDHLMARVETTLERLALLEREEANVRKKEARVPPPTGAGGPGQQGQGDLQLPQVPQGNKTRIYPLDELIRRQQSLDTRQGRLH